MTPSERESSVGACGLVRSSLFDKAYVDFAHLHEMTQIGLYFWELYTKVTISRRRGRDYFSLLQRAGERS